MKAYTDYPSKPILINTSQYPDVLTSRSDGTMVWEGGLRRSRKKFSKEHVFDLALPAMYGLFDDLIPGAELTEQFLEEWECFQKAYSSPDSNIQYGIWFYYPLGKHLVRFAPTFWHRLALLTRTSTLLRDSALQKTWQEVRHIFDRAVIAIAGCSVGNNAAHAVAGDLRPLHIKLADQKDFHIPNANRVRLGYGDFGRNKALVTAEQLHAVDPFLRISDFQEGIHSGNIADFVGGNKDLEEPPASVVIEETDDPDIKIFIRKAARSWGVPVIMVSDLGSAVQLDIRRFDKDRTLSLAACGMSDEELYDRRDSWQRDLANRDLFYEFAFALIGKNYRHVEEFRRIIFQEDPPFFASVPQLGSTAMMAGGVAAEAVGRLLLGFPMPERMFINKHTGHTILEGERL